jgi:folate-binding protein YgfZ
MEWQAVNSALSSESTSGNQRKKHAETNGRFSSSKKPYRFEKQYVSGKIEIMMEVYQEIHKGKPAFYREKRGLMAVWGKEATQFLNGMVTNDVRKLQDGEQISAAFANAQGRLQAVVRIKKISEKLIIETEAATHQKIFQHLFKFTMAGDFFVEDLSAKYNFFRLLNLNPDASKYNAIKFNSAFGVDLFIPSEYPQSELQNALEIPEDVYEIIRIESGEPRYGIDMDENTVVPELGLKDLISYNKGCYLGQEIIARIHFRGHVAKQLTGLAFDEVEVSLKPREQLFASDNKVAGFVTSVRFSPFLGKAIGLGYVRYEYLNEGTKLIAGKYNATVHKLPFLSYAFKAGEVSG